MRAAAAALFLIATGAHAQTTTCSPNGAGGFICHSISPPQINWDQLTPPPIFIRAPARPEPRPDLARLSEEDSETYSEIRRLIGEGRCTEAASMATKAGDDTYASHIGRVCKPSP